jgi:hypothetical protein
MLKTLLFLRNNFEFITTFALFISLIKCHQFFDILVVGLWKAVRARDAIRLAIATASVGIAAHHAHVISGPNQRL